MSDSSSANSEMRDIENLKKQNISLQQQVDELKKSTPLAKKQSKNYWRSFFAGLLATLVVIFFTLFNISYWTQQTIMDDKKFVATMSPLIRDPAIQAALQTEIVNVIFTNINVEKELETRLPSNLDFIAGPFSQQIRTFVNSQVGNVIKSPQVATVWDQLLTTTHTSLMSYLENPKNDGVITIDSIYQIASTQLKNTQIGFIFNNQLPASIANIQITDIKVIPKIQKYLHLMQQLTKQLAVASIVGLILAVLLSMRRRNIAVYMLSAAGVGMLITKLAIYIGSTQIGSQVPSQFSAAAVAAYDIITSPLNTQTNGFLALIVALLVIVLVSGSYAWAVSLRGFIYGLLDSITANFVSKKSKNAPTWLGYINKYKTVINWAVVGLSFLIFAFRLPPTCDGAVWAVVVSAVGVLIVDVFASVYRQFDKKK